MDSRPKYNRWAHESCATEDSIFYICIHCDNEENFDESSN